MTIRIEKNRVLLIAILALGLFLRIYRLPELMVFGGDVARDYLEAKNITLEGKIPLLGSPTSVPWLHQGAFYTYLLGIVLFLARYNPLSGGYFAALTGVLSIYVIFKLGKLFFSEKAGLWASFFYGVSPLVVIFDRYPYHQNLISIFTMLLFASLYKSLKKPKFFVLSFFVFGLLMQLELSNLVLAPVLAIMVFDYRKEISFKNLILCLAAFLFTWIPKIIYDIPTGFTQTLGFAAWFLHKLLPVDLINNQPGASLPLLERFSILLSYLSRMIVWQSPLISAILSLGVTAFLLKNFRSCYLLLLWIFIPLFGFIIQGSPSESYVPVIFAVFPLGFGYFVSRVKSFKIPIYLISIFIGMISVFVLLENNYFVLTGKETNAKNDYNLGPSYRLNTEMAKHIVKEAKGEKFSIIPLGVFGHFPSAKLNLVYLTWYFGNSPSETEEKLKFFVYDNSNYYTLENSESVKEFSFMTVVKANED
ncbi:glycosyltransferase family 39 protein [Patescibacteria group bacterium]|nr:glycosyltransferase family 39 protein [Patescibacteria group bacterium]